MIEFVRFKLVDGEIVSYTTSTPPEPIVEQPHENLPPHVLANVALRHELEVEYLYPERNHRRHYHSHASGRHFADRDSADAWWKEYGEALNEIKDKEAKPT